MRTQTQKLPNLLAIARAADRFAESYDPDDDEQGLGNALYLAKEAMREVPAQASAEEPCQK